MRVAIARALLKNSPVLLLDDVLSELDEQHRMTLLEAVREFGAQVLLTTADSAQLIGSPIASIETVVMTPGSAQPQP